MAKAAQSIVEEQAESTDLAIMATVNPVVLFTDREQFSAFYKKLKEETDREREALDVTTERGRKAIRSLAFRVTKAKTTLVKAGLGLTEGWREQIKLVNASRDTMEQELAALADEVRRPLTEWEEAEKARVERCRATIERMKQAAVVTMDDTSATVRDRGAELWRTEIGEDFADLADEAKAVKETAVATLQRAMERLTQEEADRAELEKLRAEAAEREARERAEREERERQERERVEAEEAERRERERQELEAQRIREAEERAAAAARAEEARKAREAEEQREQERREAEAQRQREHETQLAEERRQREEAERIARQEREQREREEEQRRAEAARVDEERRRKEEEDRAREADRVHRAKVIDAATAAIVRQGVTKKLAEKVVLAIIAGEVPAVSLRF